MNITDLEIEYLTEIAFCEMNPNNGEAPDNFRDVNTYSWPKERAQAMGISEKALGGVMGSLVKKGLIWFCEEPGDRESDGVGFTEFGFKVWSLNFKEKL